ncbi:MAG: hypothetical protein OEZ47_06970 [Gammaproteobacteria bacterium]|nr:hypothetical protein [Gammaproteobacteria bacterium]
MISKLWIAVAGVFAIGAGLIWFSFLRPVPMMKTQAEVVAKTHKPAGTHWQQQVGLNRGFRTATPISMDESYVLELYSKELDATGFYSVNKFDQKDYEIGQKVTMEYKKHGMPVFGYKTTVYEVHPN